MSGFITTDGADYLLNLMTASEPVVSSYYVALCTDEPGVSINGDELSEPTTPDYVRAGIEVVSGNFDTTAGSMSNTIEISFTVPTVDWGPVNYWALCDAEVGGRVLFAGALEDAFVSIAGEQIFMPPGSLTVDFDVTAWSTDQ